MKLFLGSTESINALGMSDDAFERYVFFLHINNHMFISLVLPMLEMMV